MEEEKLSELQLLRRELSMSLQHLPDYKIIELFQDYGIDYSPCDSNQVRILMLLVAAEKKILEKR